jgi:hypothetical protein
MPWRAWLHGRIICRGEHKNENSCGEEVMEAQGGEGYVRIRADVHVFGTHGRASSACSRASDASNDMTSVCWRARNPSSVPAVRLVQGPPEVHIPITLVTVMSTGGFYRLERPFDVYYASVRCTLLMEQKRRRAGRHSAVQLNSEMLSVHSCSYRKRPVEQCIVMVMRSILT